MSTAHHVATEQIFFQVLLGINNNTKLPSNLRQTTRKRVQQRDFKIVTDNMPTITLYTHYLQFAKTLSETELCRLQNHININIVIIILLDCIRYTSDNSFI